MALVYDGSNGLFTRLGKIIYLLDLVRGYQSTIVTEISDIKAEYSSADSYMVAALGEAEAQAKSLDPLLASLQSAAATTLIEMCYAEATAGNANAMLAKSTRDAIIWLIKQMKTNSETIERNTVGKGTLTADAGNNGNGTVVALVETPNILLGNSANWPNIRAEVLDIRCITDAQNGSIARGVEIFQIRGQPAFSTLDRRYPAGSGRAIQASALCANVDAGPRYQNILTNSDFEQMTSNVPEFFTVSSGTAGTDFLTETTTFFTAWACVGCLLLGLALGLVCSCLLALLSFAIGPQDSPLGLGRWELQEVCDVGHLVRCAHGSRCLLVDAVHVLRLVTQMVARSHVGVLTHTGV